MVAWKGAEAPGVTANEVQQRNCKGDQSESTKTNLDEKLDLNSGRGDSE